MQKTLQQQLAEAEKRAAQIRARIEQKEARTASNNRKLDTRRKIIFGGYFLSSLRGKDEKLIGYLTSIIADETLRVAERKVMIEDIKTVKKLGADGIVLGILKKNGEVDFEATQEMVELAYPMKTAFHRAIDVTPDPIAALELIIESGCVRVLTSGQHNKAIDGINIIGDLVEKAQIRIEIMAGAGVNAENAPYFLEKGVNALHLTGNSIRNSPMEYRKENVSMSDIESISEFDLVYSDLAKIRAVVEILKR